MRPLAPADVVRGQFRGYREEDGVAADSSVETFAAVRLAIDTWRWAGVPFFLRAGKCLPVTATEVMVTLKRPPQAVFGEIEPTPVQLSSFSPQPERFDRPWRARQGAWRSHDRRGGGAHRAPPCG